MQEIKGRRLERAPDAATAAPPGGQAPVVPGPAAPAEAAVFWPLVLILAGAYLVSAWARRGRRPHA